MIEANQILAKMKNQKINYDKVLRKIISQWERDGERQESIRDDTGDMIRWIDNSVMLADCLTNTMKPEHSEEALTSNTFDLTPIDDSLRRKQVSQDCRKNKKKS